MKHLVVPFLFSFTVVVGSAQGMRERVEKLQKSGTDSFRIVVYQELVRHYRYSQFDSAVYFAKEGLAYARKKQYHFGEAMMINGLAQVNEGHGFLKLAKAQYAEAREVFIRIGDKSGIAAATNGLGVIAGRTGNYQEATQYFLEALILFEQIANTPGVVQTYIKLGVVSDILGNLDHALKYYVKAENLNKDPFSPSASLTLLNNIGIIYGKKNDIPTALKYFRKGLRESDPGKSIAGHVALLGSLGLAYEKSGNRDSAFHFQKQALSMAKTHGMLEEEARALVNMSSLLRENDLGESFMLLEEALVITERIQQLSLMTEVYESMIHLFKRQNKYREALALSEKRQLLKDSLFSIQKSKEIANLHANQELAKQENEITSLALQNEQSTMQRNIMMVVALIAVALICIVWYYNTQISRLNTELIRNQKELKNSNTVKDKLFSILGHDLRAPLSRVIGLLNVLALKERTQDESGIIEKLRHQSTNTLETLDNLLLWGQRQLKGIRLNQQTIPVRERVEKSIYLAGDYAAQKEIVLVNHTSPDVLVYADPSHFDFVMRNLLSNAVKFSHSGGSVVVDAHLSADKEVVLSVTDSGVGIRKEMQAEIFSFGNESVKGTWNEKGTGIGLMLCREYITENGGRLWVESDPGQGATFYICLKQNDGVLTEGMEPVGQKLKIEL
jgi:signal transduction histidine kinase